MSALTDELQSLEYPRLRRERPEDHGLIEQLFRESRTAELAALPDEGSRALFTRMQLAARGSQYVRVHPGAEALVILDGHTAIGRILVERSPERLHIVDLAVVDAAQRRGHGAAVLAELFNQADAAGLPVTLNVDAENVRARAFYAAQGFVAAATAPPPGGHLSLRRPPRPERHAA